MKTGKLSKITRHRFALFILTAAVLTFGIVGVVLAADVSVEVADRYGFAEATLDDGAIVQYIGDLNTTYGSAGSGVFNPFVRLQGNNKKTADQKGYNTDGTREWDTKAGTWTHSILLSEIPTVLVDGNVYWEFFADINDNDNTPLISLDDFELYLTDDPELSGYPFTGFADLIYDYTAANNGYYILINDVNQGSGRGDLRYLVPVSDVGVEDCNYGNPACTTYLVLYSVWGGKGTPYDFDGGFEEWKVKKYPILTVSKDVYGSYDTPVSWTITKDFDGTYYMFAGESVTHDYEVSVDPIFGAPQNTMVYGAITILGDEKDDVDATITDFFDGTPATITGCSVPANLDGTYPIAAGATVTCDYELALGAPVAGTNLARASFDFDAVSLAFQGSADIAVADYVETLTGYPDIDVTDTNGESWMASASSETWTYTRDFTCPTTTSLYVDGFYSFTHDNTATITQTGQSDDATVVVNCYAPVVEKTADEFFTRYWEWSIVKDYDGDYDLFAGESVTHDYKVSVDPTYSDNDWLVSGTITIYNNHPSEDMALTSVGDVAGGIDADVTCPSLTVPAGGQLDCTYATAAQDSPDDNPFGGTNTATAVFAGSNWTGMYPIDFPTDPTSEVDPVITVDDDNLTGEMWSADRAHAEWTYTRDFSCPTDLTLYTDGVLVLDDHVNTATIVETGDYDIATVEVTCYALLVSKDANPSLTRTFHWTIQKDVDNPGPISLQGGESVVVNYTVYVALAEPPYTDSEWAVAGAITIDNPSPDDAALSAVTDVVSPDIVAAVDCPSFTVPAGGSLECSYSASLPDAAFRTNTATATLADIGTSFSGSADVDFSLATVNEIDEMVDVYDDYLGSLGTWHYDDAPITFAYAREITAPDAFCGSFTVDNTATFTTNDTGTTGSDDASVIIEVPCEGCTPGFWQGGNGSQLWNDPSVFDGGTGDPDWPGVLPQPFSHDTLFNDFFSDVTDPALDGKTMWDMVYGGGGSIWAEKAARDMVAAYLNESAFPDTYPADSLADLEAEWYAAVAGGDAGYQAFHLEKSGWNDPPDPGYCPL